MLIPNKREFLARGLTRFGAIGLLERLERRAAVVVMTYHRIGEPAEGGFYDGVYSASAEAFRAEVRALRDRFRLVGLDELIDSRLDVKRPTALITFDDGYRDNAEVALPILRELGAPATFFLPSGLLGAPRLPWWDHAAFVIKQTEQSRVALEWPERLEIEPGTGPRTAAIARVIGLYLAGKVADEPGFRAHLEERAGVVVDDEALGRSLFMSWDQARGLAAAGMTIGSHSHGHRKLAALDEEAQWFELVESKRVLEAETGREVRALAYPFGWAGTFDDRTERLAREAGYLLAFTAVEGINRPGQADPFALRRLNVGYHDSPALLRARTALQTSLGRSFL
jgi:peptidoglycan/xylan/chitin deacetylase (PgdA/CDA1 family)